MILLRECWTSFKLVRRHFSTYKSNRQPEKIKAAPQLTRLGFLVVASVLKLFGRVNSAEAYQSTLPVMAGCFDPSRTPQIASSVPVAF